MLRGIIDRCHEQFKADLAPKEERPHLGERIIFISFVWMDDHKSEIFWHIASIEKKDDRLPILPCTNDRVSAICKENCIECEWLIYPRGEERAHVYSVQCELSG